MKTEDSGVGGEEGAKKVRESVTFRFLIFSFFKMMGVGWGGSGAGWGGAGAGLFTSMPSQDGMAEKKKHREYDGILMCDVSFCSDLFILMVLNNKRRAAHRM